METAGNPKKLKISKLILIAIIGFILLLIIAFLIFSPNIARNYLNKNGKELTGRKLSIEDISINYFTTTVQLTGAKMFEQNDKDVFIGLDTILVDLKPLRLFKKEIFIQQFKVVNLDARIIQKDTLFNFDDLIAFYSSEDTVTSDAESSSYSFDLNNLAIDQGKLSYTDKEIDHTISVKDITFFIPHLYWGGEQDSKADVAFDLGTGGSFSSTFDYNVETGAYSGEAQVTKMQLGVILPYIQQYMRFGSLDGTLTAEINFNGTQEDLMGFQMSGDARVDSMSITDDNGQKVLGVEKAKVRVSEMKPMKYEAQIKQVIFEHLYMYLELADSLFNFEKMIVESAEDTAAVTEEDAVYQVMIDSLQVKSGWIDFSDKRFREPFDYELSEISVNTENLSLDTDWITLSGSMLLNKRGKLEAKVGVNPYDPLSKIDLEYVLSDFQLPDINIYSKHYTGLPILFGDMYYLNKTTINNKKLNSENQLIIRNVELGRKNGGLYDIPLKLALFILKDINGDVKLDIPVTGDLSDPRTRIGRIVWTTFKQFMVKIVASPFKALGNLLGAQPDELEEITFVYSDTSLTGKQRRGLDLLLKLEEMKPGMQIEMQYLNDRKLERADAAEQIVHEDYQTLYQNDPKSHRKEYEAFLKEKSGLDSLLIQDYELMLAPTEKVDSVIQARENMRIQLVKNYLTTANDSTAIEVLDYNKEEVLNIGSRPKFQIKYTLQEESATTTDAN
ncbi:DUF748 domain-containing protein [Maribellus sp. YY47]|uniref:DUF748 domain-containing protein n=1 Tax=Maribellus sp. YY47 TaxID=2929486 RepID=UPI002000EF19|nr:DUF748 domain-containing protein [Maribellus sp. YY47]MCK3682777.1 DUF748 domain-containing protein [Maribellus sp. YY47]